MPFATLLSLCLLAVLQWHPFTTWPAVWCGNEYKSKNRRCLVYAEVKGTSRRSRGWASEPVGSSLVELGEHSERSLCAGPGPPQASVTGRQLQGVESGPAALTQNRNPGSPPSGASAYVPARRSLFSFKGALPFSQSAGRGLLDECLFKWGQ